MSNQQHPIIPPPKLAMHFRGVPLIPPLDCTDPQSWIAEQIYQMGATLAQTEPKRPTDETKEAMISALNTLEGWDNFDHWVWPVSALEQAKKNTTESLQMLRVELAQPEPPDDVEVAELVAWLRDRANSTSLAHTARRITRAADLLERLASDNAGLAAAAADSLYTDNMSLLDSHHD
jgi:hypothetical protein